MRKKGKQANFQRLGNILQDILKKHNITIDPEEQHLLELWHKAVGPQISAHTRTDKLKRNTLSVKVSSSVWMHQLHLLKSEIIEKINILLGVASNRLRALRTVRGAGQVTEVDQIIAGQGLFHGVGNGHTADTRVKYTDHS